MRPPTGGRSKPATFAGIAPVVPDPRRIKVFATEAAFEKWLGAHHDVEPEVWIKVYKSSSGLASVTPAKALDVALCWGWIDGIRKGFDERSFLQRYCPRGPRSMWSEIRPDCALEGATRSHERVGTSVDVESAHHRSSRSLVLVLPTRLIASICATLTRC